MGNQESHDSPTKEEVSHDHTSIESQFQLESQQLDDNYGGEIKVLRNKQTNQLYALKTRHCTTREEFEQVCSQTNRLKQIQHESMVQIAHIVTQADDGFCSNIFSVQTVFEYCQKTLQQVIVERTLNHKHYEEEEIIKIMKAILSAVVNLFQRQLYNGNITTKHVLISMTNQIKMAIPYLMNNINHYNRVLCQVEKDCFLSPDLFEQIGQNKIQPRFDHQKTEVFSIGMIGLRLSLLQDTNLIYNYKTFQVNEAVLDDMLQLVSQKYSSDFTSVLRKFLACNENQRCDFSQATEILDQIKNFGNQNPMNTKGLEITPIAPIFLSDLKQTNPSPLTSQKRYSNLQAQNLISHSSKHSNNLSPERKETEQSQQKLQQPLQHSLTTHNYSKVQEKSIHDSPDSHNKSQQKKDTSYSSQPSSYIIQQKIENSLKSIENMVKDAIEQSQLTKSRYENSQHLKSFMKELLNDEVFVPLQSSPSSKSQKRIIQKKIKGQSKHSEQMYNTQSQIKKWKN